MKTCAPVIKDSIEVVADVAKCVTVIGAAFQVASLSLNLLDMASEMRHGLDVLPNIRRKIEDVHKKVVECMIPILHPDGELDEELIVYVFRGAKQVWTQLSQVETHLMSHKTRQFLRASDMKKIKIGMEQLRKSLIPVWQTKNIVKNSAAVKGCVGDIAQLTGDVSQLKLGVLSVEIPLLRERPKFAPHFVGRLTEFDDLEKILERYGSGAIMRLGGAGKTQLMIAFVDRADKEGLIPGESFWIPAHGSKKEFIAELADFTEALIGKKLRDEERIDERVLIPVVRKKLDSFVGK